MSRLILLAGVGLVLVGPLAAHAQASKAPKHSDHAPQASPPIEFPFEAHGVYSVVAAPGRITDIALEPGEALVETNPIAAGDTARWVIGDTSSGEGATRRVHVLVKPTAPNLSTNLVINTDRRTYFLDVRASSRAYLTQVAWRYSVAAAVATGLPAAMPIVAVEPPRLNFGYVVSGPVRLRPLQVFDDGARVVIVFGAKLSLTDMPPLYRVGSDGKASELINYRVEGQSFVVDRLFDQAELRLGTKHQAGRVRIARDVKVPEAAR